MNRSPGFVLTFYSKKQRSKVTFQSHTANEKQSEALTCASVATVKHPDQDNLEKKEVIWVYVSGGDQSIMAGKDYNKQQVCCRRQEAKRVYHYLYS